MEKLDNICKSPQKSDLSQQIFILLDILYSMLLLKTLFRVLGKDLLGEPQFLFFFAFDQRHPKPQGLSDNYRGEF